MEPPREEEGLNTPLFFFHFIPGISTQFFAPSLPFLSPSNAAFFRCPRSCIFSPSLSPKHPGQKGESGEKKGERSYILASWEECRNSPFYFKTRRKEEGGKELNEMPQEQESGEKEKERESGMKTKRAFDSLVK